MSRDQQHTSSKLHTQNIMSYPYAEYGIKGVGQRRLPIVSMDQYIDHSQDQQLHIECCKGLALSEEYKICLLYTSPSPRDGLLSRMPSSA